MGKFLFGLKTTDFVGITDDQSKPVRIKVTSSIKITLILADFFP